MTLTYVYIGIYCILSLGFATIVQSLDCFDTPRYRNCNFYNGLSGDACILACMYPSLSGMEIRNMFKDWTDVSVTRLEYVFNPSDYGDWMCPPMYIGGLTHLVNLSVSGIDDAIYSTNLVDVMVANLRTLKSFHMSDNKLKANYPTFKNSPSLTDIHLINNRFVGAPPASWSTLKNLTSITISRASTTFIPPYTWGNMTGILSIDLSQNDILAVPYSWAGMTNLRRLNLSRNAIINLPDVWSNLVNLQMVDLSHNAIVNLPKDWSNLTNLQFVDASNNRIGLLPDQWSSLMKLKTLVLSSNSLSTLPSLSPALEHLDVSSNRLSAIPNDMGKRLKTIILRNNRFQNSPPMLLDMLDLERIDLSENAIGNPPSNWTDLKALRVIQLSSTNIDGLPPSWANMTYLRAIDLSNNRLSILPDFLMKHRTLDILVVRNNLLTTLPPHLNNMSVLDVSQNRVVDTLPESWSDLRNIQSLNLSHNAKLVGSIPYAWTSIRTLKVDVTMTGISLTSLITECLKTCKDHSLQFLRIEPARILSQAHLCPSLFCGGNIAFDAGFNSYILCINDGEVALRSILLIWILISVPAMVCIVLSCTLCRLKPLETDEQVPWLRRYVFMALSLALSTFDTCSDIAFIVQVWESTTIDALKRLILVIKLLPEYIVGAMALVHLTSQWKHSYVTYITILLSPVLIPMLHATLILLFVFAPWKRVSGRSGYSRVSSDKYSKFWSILVACIEDPVMSVVATYLYYNVGYSNDVGVYIPESTFVITLISSLLNFWVTFYTTFCMSEILTGNEQQLAELVTVLEQDLDSVTNVQPLNQR
jgi:Leucine-rich repeat (LRR) protein